MLFRRLLFLGFRSSVVIVGLGLTAGALGLDGSWLDLASHFQVYYLICSIILVVVFGGLRSWKWLSAAALCGAVSAAAVLPWYFTGATSTDDPASTRSMRVLVSNVYWLNANYGPIAAAIEECNADLVVLCELTPSGVHGLKDALAPYPHRFVQSQYHPQGIAVFSRAPITSQRVERLGMAGHPTLLLSLEVGGRRLWIVATHPTSALSADSHRLRNDQLTALPALINALPGQKLLVGDLNITMWSPFYKRLETATGLVNVRQGFGVAPTWPSFLPEIARLPIDHVLVSRDIGVAAVRTVELPGSDHAGLVVDLEFP